MDDKPVASTNLMRGKSFGFINLQANSQLGPQPFQGFIGSSSPRAHDGFAVRNRSVQKPDMPVSFLDRHGEAEVREHVDGNNESEKEKKESPWQRVKWTDQMVKFLITAVSYIGEDGGSDCGGGKRRISPLLPKKGKWKAISKVMAERGFLVSPQQSEDKFNDLNKRYKKLNDILGSGTSCEVVENPALLDSIDISEKSKDSVRKILSSKQLFYQEMCSYHNGNRLYIPHDQAIQKSLHSALRNTDDEEENDVSDCPNDNSQKKHASNEDVGSTKVPAKRKKLEEHEYVDSDLILNFQIMTKKSALHDHAKMNQVFGQSASGEWQGNHLFMSRSLQLEEHKLQIEAEMLELEKQRLKWLRFSEIEDRDLEKMRLENRYLKLENERLGLEIRRREMSGHANTN
ncbi:hypothetical protein DH2020_030870 [Rehmannia glutinosa]|uniref:Myb/SANT-like DNA-binding domain-containing protein n=1 Tax=Rehmannia glutinosa TaxID=99300 RepID=A0ABR0VML0_REHGL